MQDRTSSPKAAAGKRGRVVAVAAALMLSAAIVAPSALPLMTSPAEAAIPGMDFSALAESVLPAVVNISTTQKVEQTNFVAPDLPQGTPFDEFFRQFRERQGQRFGRDGERPNEAPTRRGMPQTALGSGFIIDPAGYIVTNNHVVGDASDIKVILQDGRELVATLVGTDEKTDLALLKVESDTPLPHVTFAKADAIKVGKPVMAVGNPFGLGGTVTAGIVSARGRDIHSGPFDDYIQTDAAINKGNSGGPLFDMDGNVVGVNTAIYSPTGGSVGIGFAIPATLVEPVIAAIREHGSVERGWLGVAIQPLTDELAESLGLPGTEGALVANVTADSPAAKAGIEPGDVVTAVSGQPVKAFRDLARLVAAVPPGSDATLDVVRGGESRSIEVAVGLSPATEVAAAEEPQAARESYGLALGPVTPEVREELGLAAGKTGAVVMNVAPDSVAAEQGIQPGDLIVKVGRDPVTGPQDAVKALDAAKGQKRPVLVQVERDGNARFLALTAKAA
ncbi:DegQ family serine endoprotease [Methylobrevis albus]|uniref:Probable periplasmic serine endoprotease DegP-like n=1 Tax=Methylobrevis albus TaxID=2793297 RepID=A0A931I2D7_9HYPH|nr:DegQ family serine endoprotease [Methylobrevis albus]MBH0237628.1 Do family serine endopeptidase [Methylobrevis albus]